ncbi:MAG: AAA family ATPase [Solirubrobacterales bacterium]|nr:AAA family ATPase [Solirubrobacterales bacterium]
MHLKSISLKGFKSFPERTVLEFAPGVSVVVGPNGSGKSNITDAVLWAMGEQSPLAVRGQKMQDVIFGGGHGVKARSSAEVELIIDNSDGAIEMPLGEISILRRLDRNGEGEYRLNGARCRLVDVLEVLSDTGLGKEMHSVVSQGRVESIVTSKPRDRRLLIEEAAGLGKHRKRRRRAQIKLDRAQENLDRCLDIEREARSQLRPLKRQAEAAELLARVERQTTEASWELVRDSSRVRRAGLETAERAATSARESRDALQEKLGQVDLRREEAEKQLAERSERREAIARRGELARSAGGKIEMRIERTRENALALADRLEQREGQLARLRPQVAADSPDQSGSERISAVEAELEKLDLERASELDSELATLLTERDEAVAASDDAAAQATQITAQRDLAELAAQSARAELRSTEQAAEQATREVARLTAELSRLDDFLREHAEAPEGQPSLAASLEVEVGLETAVAAVLGARLRAAIVDDLPSGQQLLARLGSEGGSALVAEAGRGAANAAHQLPGARALADFVTGGKNADLGRRLLAGVWLVDSLDSLPGDFVGVAVTREGRAWNGATGELRQSAQGSGEQVLAERQRREKLAGEAASAGDSASTTASALAAVEQACVAAEQALAAADDACRAAEREAAQAAERARRAEWIIEQRRGAPEQGAGAVARAQLEGELAAERRVAEQAAEARDQRKQTVVTLEMAIAYEVGLVPLYNAFEEALAAAQEAIAERTTIFEAELEADRLGNAGVTDELRAFAQSGAELQGALREAGEAVTAAEVTAQQSRDQHAETEAELVRLAELLGLEAEPSSEPLDDEAIAALEQRIVRLERRREQIGPVNPLAKAQYEEALEHVETLEHQRTDLETAMRELRTLIRDTDRQIRESFEQTFEAAAKNFEELAAHCFPGGHGRLRLVREEQTPKAVLGGGEGEEEVARLEAAEDEANAEAERETGEPEDDLGVEIEITPAGKSMKRLTLLSGGEKSMTAIAFLFSVFLAKPCPFYILDEVEAALDDLNIGRFLELLRLYRDRAQFIVVTHQQRTMEAADSLYGVSMGGDGVSKVISRKLPAEVDADSDAVQAA